MNEIGNLKKALKYAYEIIHGNGKRYGLIECLDPYYNGAYDAQLAHLEKLMKQTKSTNSKPKTNEQNQRVI